MTQFLKIFSSKISHRRRDNSNEYKTDKPWLNLQFHYFNQTSVKNPKDLEDEMEKPESSIDENILDRIQGSMIGLALGNALGTYVESQTHQYMLENPVTDLHGGGTTGLHKRQFTHDTSMALCLAVSLVTQKDFNLYDQLVRYKWWYKHGYMSSTGECSDIGAATRQSLNVFEYRQICFAEQYKIPKDKIDYLSDKSLLSQFDVYCGAPEAIGNGALMRLTPVPLFFYRSPSHAVEYSGHSGQITHGNRKVYDACRYYGALIVAALHGYKKEQLLDKQFYQKHKHWFGKKPLCNEIKLIAEGSYQKNGGYNDGIRGKHDIVNALEAALWAFWSDGNSFERGALAAVNLGDDADTTAAIYGQLAGVYYGYKKLPSNWIKHLYAKKFILNLSEWITYEGSLWKPLENMSQLTPKTSPQTSPHKSDTNLVLPEQNSDKKHSQTESSHSTKLITEIDPQRKKLDHSTSVNTENQSIPSVASVMNDETSSCNNTDSCSIHRSPPISSHSQSTLNNSTSNKQPTTTNTFVFPPNSYQYSEMSSDNTYQNKSTMHISRSESALQVIVSPFDYIGNEDLSAINNQNPHSILETSFNTTNLKARPEEENSSKLSSKDVLFYPTSDRDQSSSPNSLRENHHRLKPKLSNIFHGGKGSHSPLLPLRSGVARMKRNRKLPLGSTEFPIKCSDTITTIESQYTDTQWISTTWKSYSTPDLDNCLSWRCEDVCDWIKSLGEVYEDYADSFRRNNVNGIHLLNFIENATLKEFGIKSSYNRRIIIHGIQQLKKKCGMSSPSDTIVVDFYKDFDGDYVPPLYLSDTTYPNNKSCVLRPNEDKIHEKLYNQILEWLGPLSSDIDIDKIELVLNTDLYRMFLQQTRRTESRQTQPEFQPHLEIETNAIERKRVLDRLSTLTQQVHHNRSVSIVRVWHGCDHTKLPKLLSTGFAALSKLDSGWFGTGMYFTSSAEYATKYTNANGCLIMCYAILLNPFPVIKDDAPPDVHCTNFRFYGRGNYSNYQCHYIPVSPVDEDTTWNFRPPLTGVQDARYDEFAIFQQADILPQVVVHLKNRLMNTSTVIPAEDSNRIFLSKD